MSRDGKVQTVFLTLLAQTALLASLVSAPSPEEEVRTRVRICPEPLPIPGPWAFVSVGDGHAAPGEVPTLPTEEAVPSHPFFRSVEPPPGWKGQGWFIRRIEIPEPYRGKVLGVFAAQVGAFELYVDGVPAASRGLPWSGEESDLPITQGNFVGTLQIDAPVADLAIRLVAPRDPFQAVPGPYVGVLLNLCEPLAGLEHIERVRGFLQRLYACFIGFCLTVGVLHLLLHLSVPDERAGHLDYAIFTGAVGSLSICVVARSFPTTLEVSWAWSYAFMVSVLALSAFGVRFFAGIVRGPRSRVRTWAGLLLVPALLLVPWMTLSMAYALAFVAMVLMLALVASAVRHRQPDRHLIFFGAAAMMVASAIQMAPELLGLAWSSGPAYIYGFIILLAAMSLHLARNVGRTHIELAGRVDEVRKLSSAHLEERERAQQAALDRMALEAENRQQAVRLAEADRRAALLGELAEANRKIRETQAQLIQTEKMASLGQLVAGVAHEMNTPIGAIHSVHQSLSRAAEKLRARLNETAPELVTDRRIAAALKVLDDGAGVVARGSQRVSEIVHRLRTFARLDEAELQRADVHEGLEDTLLLARHELKHGIEVVRSYGQLPRIACFPGQLNQVFLNLVINARHSMGEKGTLTLTTRDVGDAIEIDVQDNGPGIPPENLGRVFDPGFTTKGVGVGTGLGLAICFRILEAHHGLISVKSAPGRGATFTLWLPKDLEDRLARQKDRLS